MDKSSNPAERRAAPPGVSIQERSEPPDGLFGYVVRFFDFLDRIWEDTRTTRVLGTVLVSVYLATLVLIELNRQGLIPTPLDAWISQNHFGAVHLAFNLLLVFEVLGLVFALADSVANSLGKQFELLSLILLRKAFLQFSEFSEPIVWSQISDAFLEMAADGAGALAVFVVLAFYYRFQRHRKITADEFEQASFVNAKKAVALLLLLAFVLLGLDDMRRYLIGDAYPFFEIFFLVLIFSDILIVLIAFRYSTSYIVVFRNAGFALATVLIRLALSAPSYVNVLIGIGAALFAMGVSLAYNAFGPTVKEESGSYTGE